MDNRYKRYESPIRYEKPIWKKSLLFIVVICVIGFLCREQFSQIFKKPFHKNIDNAYTITIIDDFGDTTIVSVSHIPESTILIPVVESKPLKDTLKIKKEKIVAKVKVDTSKVSKNVINNDYIQTVPNISEETIQNTDIKDDIIPVEPIKKIDSNITDKIEEKVVKKRRFRLFKRRN